MGGGIDGNEDKGLKTIDILKGGSRIMDRETALFIISVYKVANALFMVLILWY